MCGVVLRRFGWFSVLSRCLSGVAALIMLAKHAGRMRFIFSWHVSGSSGSP